MRIDHPERVDDLVEQGERYMGYIYLTAIRKAKESLPLDMVAVTMQQGKLNRTLDYVTDTIGAEIARGYTEMFLNAGREGALFLNGDIRKARSTVAPNMDPTEREALAHIRKEQQRLIRAFAEQQREATKGFLFNSEKVYRTYHEQARMFVDSIGLSHHQQKAVNSYEALLNKGSRQVLRRALRDKGFDSSVVAGGQLSHAQISTMTDHYRQNYLRYRAGTIAQTEATRAINSGTDFFYQQAKQLGHIKEVYNIWITRMDSRVRHTHMGLHGVKKKMGVPWKTSNGNLLRYPGDPRAPASEIVRCRCRLRKLIVLKSKSRDYDPVRPGDYTPVAPMGEMRAALAQAQGLLNVNPPLVTLRRLDLGDLAAQVRRQFLPAALFLPLLYSDEEEKEPKAVVTRGGPTVAEQRFSNELQDAVEKAIPEPGKLTVDILTVYRTFSVSGGSYSFPVFLAKLKRSAILGLTLLTPKDKPKGGNAPYIQLDRQKMYRIVK